MLTRIALLALLATGLCACGPEEESREADSRPAAIDLLGIVRPDEHNLKNRRGEYGNWQLVGGVLVSPVDVAQARIHIPCDPPLEYDLTLEATRRNGVGGFGIGIIASGRTAYIHLDSGGNSRNSGLDPIDGVLYMENETRRERNVPVLPSDRSVTIECKVRRDGVRVLADGNEIIDWQGDLGRVGSEEPWFPVESLMLDTWLTRVEVTRFEMTPVPAE